LFLGHYIESQARIESSHGSLVEQEYEDEESGDLSSESVPLEVEEEMMSKSEEMT